MSTRNMKKIFGDDVIPVNDNNSASDTDVLTTNDTKYFNVFDVLNQTSDSDGRDVSDKQDNEDVAVNDENCDKTKRKRRKKKRKKAEDVKNQQQRIAENDENADEIERSILEVNQLFGEPLPGCSNQISELQQINKKSKEDILAIEHRHLDPYNELKKIFGSKTVQADRSKKLHRGHGHLKKTWLVSRQDYWRPVGKSGLSMSLDYTMDNTGNVQYFVYEHGCSYRQTQLKFLQAVESLNPENIISIVNAHPYHIDALLQLAELSKLREDLPMAAAFIERALYGLESAFHLSFNVTTTQCRLDYRKQQNRALFIALFKHLGFVGGRACYRTSLEFCKLLLSLDPENDPLAVVLFIDFYALKAREYKWFIEFCDLWESSRNLTQLPNIAYNLAVVHFHLGNKSKADEYLQNALIMFPGVLMPLLEMCNIKTDARVMQHNFFNSQAQTSTWPALEKLQQLYVARSFHLWKEADILPWLEKCVHMVLDRVESNDDYVKYCRVKRGKRYQGKLPRNILRHIILSDIKEVTVNIQEMQNEGPVLSYDPLPPLDSIDIYKKTIQDERLVQTSTNIFSLFFTSLFTNLDSEAATDALNELRIFEENDDHA